MLHQRPNPNPLCGTWQRPTWSISPRVPLAVHRRRPLHGLRSFFGFFQVLLPTTLSLSLYTSSYPFVHIAHIRHESPSVNTNRSLFLFQIPVKMGSTVLPYMETKPKMIFFTDFDGTITVDDSEIPTHSLIGLAQC